MRISDWSSDVCSSDLPGRRRDQRLHVLSVGAHLPGQEPGEAGRRRDRRQPQWHLERSESRRRGALRRQGAIGRASCRERVCQYVSISVVAVSLKKKITNSNYTHFFLSLINYKL